MITLTYQVQEFLHISRVLRQSIYEVLKVCPVGGVGQLEELQVLKLLHAQDWQGCFSYIIID